MIVLNALVAANVLVVPNALLFKIASEQNKDRSDYGVNEGNIKRKHPILAKEGNGSEKRKKRQKKRREKKLCIKWESMAFCLFGVNIISNWLCIVTLMVIGFSPNRKSRESAKRSTKTKTTKAFLFIPHSRISPTQPR